MMNNFAYMLVGGSALLTIALTQALGLSLSAAPANAEEKKEAKIIIPVITTNGLTITPTLKQKKFKAGETPTVTVTVKNTSAKLVELDLILTDSIVAAGSAMSRALILPQEKSRTLRIAVKPGATKTYTLAAMTAVPTGKDYSLRLQAGNKMVNLLNTATLKVITLTDMQQVMIGKLLREQK